MQRRLVIGREDGGKQRVEELDSLAARDEHDEFALARKLKHGHVTDSLLDAQMQVTEFFSVHSRYLVCVQYESSQTDQSDLTRNHHHKLLQSLGYSKALGLAGLAGVRGQRCGDGGVRDVDADGVV